MLFLACCAHLLEAPVAALDLDGIKQVVGVQEAGCGSGRQAAAAAAAAMSGVRTNQHNRL